MNRPVTLLMLAVLLASTFVPAVPAYAQAGSTTLRVQAFFDRRVSTLRPGDPCVRTRVQIDGEENLDTGLNQVQLRITEFDDCVPPDDFGLLAEWFSVTEVPDNALRINPNGNNAHLRATLTACNLVSPHDCRTLAINVHWKAVGDAPDGSAVREARAMGKIRDLTNDLDLAPDEAVIAFIEVSNAP